jgi:hypothetical protein
MTFDSCCRKVDSFGSLLLFNKAVDLLVSDGRYADASSITLEMIEIHEERKEYKLCEYLLNKAMKYAGRK